MNDIEFLIIQWENNKIIDYVRHLIWFKSAIPEHIIGISGSRHQYEAELNLQAFQKMIKQTF